MSEFLNGQDALEFLAGIGAGGDGPTSFRLTGKAATDGSSRVECVMFNANGRVGNAMIWKSTTERCVNTDGVFTPPAGNGFYFNRSRCLLSISVERSDDMAVVFAPANRTKAIVEGEYKAAIAAEDFTKAALLKKELTALTV